MSQILKLFRLVNQSWLRLEFHHFSTVMISGLLLVAFLKLLLGLANNSNLSFIYTRDGNVCPRWPVYEVKCLYSRGWEWGREGGHSHWNFNIWFLRYEPCDLNLVMISSLASKWLKNGHSNFKVLAFWSHWRYHDKR